MRKYLNLVFWLIAMVLFLLAIQQYKLSGFFVGFLPAVLLGLIIREVYTLITGKVIKSYWNRD